MTDKEFTKVELHSIIEIEKSITNGQIFEMCREFQDHLIKQDINITNIGEVYWWIRDARDELLKAG